MKHNTMTNYYCFNAYTKVTIITVIIIHVYKCPVNDLILESCLAIFFYVFLGFGLVSGESPNFSVILGQSHCFLGIYQYFGQFVGKNMSFWLSTSNAISFCTSSFPFDVLDGR